MRKVRESLRIDEPQDALDLRALSADLRSWPAGAMDSLDGLETKDQAAQPKAPEPMDLEIGPADQSATYRQGQISSGAGGRAWRHFSAIAEI